MRSSKLKLNWESICKIAVEIVKEPNGVVMLLLAFYKVFSFSNRTHGMNCVGTSKFYFILILNEIIIFFKLPI